MSLRSLARCPGNTANLPWRAFRSVRLEKSSWLLLLLFATVAMPVAKVRAQIGVCSSPNSINCYRFICNGMDASGVIDQVCNSCTNTTAPRWYQPTVPVRVDRTTVPSSLGTAGWATAIDGAFAAWANVSTSNLVFQDIGPATNRGFGENGNQHEIFWITNATEWQQKVGGGINGALGVTIPQYGCGNPGQIFDSDLVMNGVGFTNWSATGASCGSGWCNSARSTVLHELGHFIGMGHPCTVCSWSAMSAQSGYDPEYPMAVDQAAITALYPGQPGGIGYGCTTSNACNNGLQCITDDDLSYCSQSCGSCPDGFECDTVAGGNFCVFSAGELAGAVGVGESCNQRPCEEELICVGGGGDYVCAETCSPAGANTCSNGFQCFALQGGGGACFDITQAAVGQFCDNANVICESGSTCVAESAQGGYCRRDCDPNNGNGCFTDEQCIPLQDQSGAVVAGACFPYGSTQEGGACVGPTDCARGHVCLRENQSSNSGRCYLRCDGEFACVDARQQCIQLDAELSYCNPTSGNLAPAPTDGGPGAGPGPGPLPDGGSTPPLPPGGCRVPRGHYDCPSGQGCLDADGDGIGECTPGAEGDTGLGGLCVSAADCNGGICHNGVCTRPCDAGQGCIAGYSCDVEAIPGGLCKADSCRDNEGICGLGYSCEYSSANRYVCAVGGGNNCACSSSTESSSQTPFGAFALMSLGALLLMRRRR